eukprot:gene21234-25512_t
MGVAALIIVAAVIVRYRAKHNERKGIPVFDSNPLHQGAFSPSDTPLRDRTAYRPPALQTSEPAYNPFLLDLDNPLSDAPEAGVSEERPRSGSSFNPMLAAQPGTQSRFARSLSSAPLLGDDFLTPSLAAPSEGILELQDMRAGGAAELELGLEEIALDPEPELVQHDKEIHIRHTIRAMSCLPAEIDAVTVKLESVQSQHQALYIKGVLEDALQVLEIPGNSLESLEAGAIAEELIRRTDHLEELQSTFGGEQHLSDLVDKIACIR